MSSDISIEVCGVSKSYKFYSSPRARLLQIFFHSKKNNTQEFWALKNINFKIKKGEVVGIIGRNGSGKSTLLQIICNTLNETSGKVNTQGRIAALLELGSGFNPEFTGRENVYVNAALLGLSKREIDLRFSQIEVFADIGSFIDQPTKTYSSGMAVRLAFSVAINVDPDILVIDEALAVGDELFQRKCFSRIEEIKKSGATILFVSHSGSLVVELCDRAILLDHGELISAGDPKIIVSNYQKMLYSSESVALEVRKSLKNLARNASPEFVNSIDVNDQEQREDFQEFFDECMEPPVTIQYESKGAYIYDPGIYTEDGRRVNCLASGSTYLYRYKVRFEEAAEDVRFGMMVKSTTGLELGGAGTKTQGDGVPIVGVGVCQVQFSFQCHLVPGVYFINAGCNGRNSSNEDTFLHRLIDAVAFRVMPLPRGQVRAGYLNFSSSELSFDIQELSH